MGEDCEIKEIKPTELNISSYIATPRKILLNDKDTLSINILDYLDRIDKGFIVGNKIKDFIKTNYNEIRQLAKEHRYIRSIPPKWLRKGILPIKILKDLNCLDINFKKEKDIYFKISHNWRRFIYHFIFTGGHEAAFKAIAERI